MNIIEIPVDDLIPYENNPRLNDEAVDAVAASIREFGFKQPVVIDKDNVIVCGHTRMKAAVLLGLDTVPAIRADDLTEEQIKAYRLADNKTAELADWDFDALTKELQGLSIDMADFGFAEDAEIGFNEDALNELFMDAPESEKKPKTVKCPHCGEEFEI